MATTPTRRFSGSARDAAEAAFKSATTKPVPSAAPLSKAPVIPGAREQVSIRLDCEVLEHFQKDGPGWQERINAALRKSLGI